MGKNLDPQGFDAGKKITGRKRHILVDTLGLLLSVVVHSADIQNRDGAAMVLNKRTRRLFPFIERIYADGGYQGPRVCAAAPRIGTWKIEIIKRSDIAKGFVVLPKRWVVERTLAWISRNRRLARDFERYCDLPTQRDPSRCTILAGAPSLRGREKPPQGVTVGRDLTFGMLKEIVVPSLGMLFICNRPPCFSTIAKASGRPSPVPLC